MVIRTRKAHLLVGTVREDEEAPLDQREWGVDMASELTPRIFAAHEASEVAHLVADHDPETPRTAALLPEDESAADAGVIALVERLHSLPKSIRSALRRAGDSAAYLSDDRLQGLAELIQNADDLGATEATIAVDSLGSRLLFSHNGAALTLHDVWALAIPWLSLKAADEEKLGRFGIGLKTLHSLSDVLEVYQGHFRVRFGADTIRPLNDHIAWPRADISLTTFAVPFLSGAIESDDAAKWLRHWDDAGLVFLRHLSTVRLVDESEREIVRLQLEYGAEAALELPGGRTSRRRVAAADGRQWLVYSRSAASPAEMERVGKAQGARTPLAFAFALHEGDTGHIHVGLPVRPVGLPFRLLAQFDPQPSRRDIADTDWNLALVPLLSDLWRDAALDVFQLAPAQGWAIVPTTAEFEADERTTGRLGACLKEHLLRRARIEFAATLTLTYAGTTHRLDELAYEAAELTAVLSPEDVRLVSGQPGVLAQSARSSDDRWREVLDDLRAVGTTTPTFVRVEDASVLLDDGQRSPQFIADLLAVAVEAGLGTALDSRACLLLDSGVRVPPASRKGLAVLLPAGPDAVWELLGIGARLHPAFMGRPHWAVIRDWLQERKWLRSSATSADALFVLAGAGKAGTALERPLTDAQVDGLRRALEAITEAERPALGAGLGRAVKVDAVVHDANGQRQGTQARPCDAYFIEREVNTWIVAAGKTPGLIWIDRRYSDKIRTDGGRDGIGAQRLFRLLGAEVAPRIKSHPANQWRYANYSPGVPASATGSPARRREALRQLQATYTLEDWIAPDLDAVLKSIATEKDPRQQRRRAGAVLGALARAWDRLREHSRVIAATPYYGWEDQGVVDAWWINSAASIAWLPSEKGRATAPEQLRIKSSATMALYGDDPERYLSPALDNEAYHEILARLGVAGDPAVTELIQKLEEVRAETNSTPKTAEDLAAPLYQALAAQVRGQRLGGQPAITARNAFGRGDGLIATRAGWRRPSVVLAGPPIFGDMRDFVPSVSGTDALWALLAIQRPTAQDARGVLGELARKKSLKPDEKLIMLEALRLLIGVPESELAKLRKAAVWVGDRWERKRPVYATRNALIAQVLKGRVPIWSPGGSLAQLDPLVDAYKLARLDAPHGQVLDPDGATYQAELTQVFSRAVANLRADLALSDPKAEQSLHVSWGELEAVTIKQSPRLRVRLVEPTYGLDETVELDTWLDLPAGVFYVADEGAIGSPSSGAYAIASVFDGDARRIAHDWVAAWSVALEGHREEEVTTAARLDAERKKERDERSEELLRELAEQGKNRRSKSKGVSDAKGSKAATATEAEPKTTRKLVDPDSLKLKNEDGEIIGGAPAGDGEPTGKRSTTSSGKPRDPDASNPKKPSVDGGRGPKNYTELERESAGLALVRRVLGGDEEQIVDIRHQRNVGADAMDDLKNFFELKVYAGQIPETISLTSSEFRRAQETEQFFLVVVGNVEEGGKAPEVRIITDPLNHLSVLPQGSVNLGGVRDAKALRFTFES
ncbi:sacsin N-terminal ATP-binding-like domain-containing protein [Micromonospora sp. WMMD730]|uniref:sacsin N-terminal ATP-binding-like domain-containing protein n=1 Tax=Micromonospora sp. WMMD730 TaxID=3404128 RepID=UPI003B92699B